MNNQFKKFHRFLPEQGKVQSRQKFVYGNFAFRSLGSFVFRKNQIEACRKSILRILKVENKLIEKKLPLLASKKEHFGFLKVCLFPNFPMSEKPKEVRMGKGKGAVSFFYFPVPKGRVIFELKNVTKIVAYKCFKEVFPKIPKPIRLVETIY